MGRALLHAFEYAPQDKPWRKNQPERGEEGAVNLVFCSILGNHTLTIPATYACDGFPVQNGLARGHGRKNISAPQNGTVHFHTHSQISHKIYYANKTG